MQADACYGGRGGEQTEQEHNCRRANDHIASHSCAGTQHGATLVLPNAGVYTRLADGSKGPRGRHCFQVSVQVPDVLSEEERSILEQLSQLT